MNVLYPATSGEGLAQVCEKLATAFELPPFQTIHRSDYLESAQSGAAFQIIITEYFGQVSSQQAAIIGRPDGWNLAWRAAVGLQYNFQVAITRGKLTRYQQRKIARRLRMVFSEIRLHGDKLMRDKSQKPAD